MQRRRLLRNLPLLMTAGIGVSSQAVGLAGEDRQALPPERREYPSPNGLYALSLWSADHWTSPAAQASLAAESDPRGPRRRMLWRQTLPHRYGPRRAFVTDAGAVVLVDEWINSPSDHALMLIDADGRTLLHQSLDGLIGVLGVQRRVMADHARLGIWLSALPMLANDGTTVTFKAGGRSLLLATDTGKLTAID